MKTPKHLVSAHDIAAAIGRNFTTAMQFLKEHNIKPVREIRTGNMTYRQYSKAAMAEAVRIANETLTRRKRKETPVQALLPFDAADENKKKDEALNHVQATLNDLVLRAEERRKRFDLDKAHTQAPTEAPPKLDIAKLIEEGQNRSEEMMSVLRSIDDRLAQLVAIWSK